MTVKPQPAFHGKFTRRREGPCAMLGKDGKPVLATLAKAVSRHTTPTSAGSMESCDTVK
jgi:hypothetical protein